MKPHGGSHSQRNSDWQFSGHARHRLWVARWRHWENHTMKTKANRSDTKPRRHLPPLQLGAAWRSRQHLLHFLFGCCPMAGWALVLLALFALERTPALSGSMSLSSGLIASYT